MSFETRKDDAEKALRKWNRANRSPVDQARLIADPERLWIQARDLAEALDNLLAHSRSRT